MPGSSQKKASLNDLHSLQPPFAVYEYKACPAEVG